MGRQISQLAGKSSVEGKLLHARCCHSRKAKHSRALPHVRLLAANQYNFCYQYYQSRKSYSSSDGYGTPWLWYTSHWKRFMRYHGLK